MKFFEIPFMLFWAEMRGGLTLKEPPSCYLACSAYLEYLAFLAFVAFLAFLAFFALLAFLAFFALLAT